MGPTHTYSSPYILREASLLLASKLLILQFIFSFFNLLVGLSWQMLQPYVSLGIFEDVYNQLAFILAIILLQFICSFIVIVRWLHRYYELRGTEVKSHKGVFFTRHDVFYLKNVDSMRMTQGFLGKLFNYGTIELHSSFVQDIFYMNAIPNPNKYIELLTNMVPTKNKYRRTSSDDGEDD